MALVMLLASLIALVAVGLAAVGGARRTHLSGRYRLLFVVALASTPLVALASSLLTLAVAVGALGLSLAGLVGLGLDAGSGRAAARLAARYLAVAATLVGVGAQSVQTGDSARAAGLLDRLIGAPTVSGAVAALAILALAMVAGLAPLGAATIGAARRVTPHTAILLLGFAPAAALIVIWRLVHGSMILLASSSAGSSAGAQSHLDDPLLSTLVVAGVLSIASGAALLRSPRDHRVWVAGLSSTLVGQSGLAVALGSADAFAGTLVALIVAIPLALLAPAAVGASGDATLGELAALAGRRPAEASLFVAATAVGLGLLPAFGFAGRVPLIAAGFGAGATGIVVCLIALVTWALAVSSAVGALIAVVDSALPNTRSAPTRSALGRAAVGALAVGASALAVAWTAIARTPGDDAAATALVAAALVAGVLLGSRAKRREERRSAPARASTLARLDKRLGFPGSRLVARARGIDWLETDALTLATSAVKPIGRASAWLLDATFGRLARS